MLPDTHLVEKHSNLDTRENLAVDFLARARAIFQTKPFQPHRFFAGGHAQTLASFFWPRRFTLSSHTDEERLFEVARDTKILAHCRWQPDPATRPTVIIWHGIEGSTGSVYMLATARKAFRAGFNVIRVNLRNCGGTEQLTRTLYHGGLTEDLRAVITELMERDGLSKLFLVGFSLGGNMVLKLAGEYGDELPKQIVAVCAVSPSIDLAASAELISQRSNWIYQRDFVRRLKNRIYLKGKLYPEVYDTSKVHLIRTLREFDERFTSVSHGFSNADDYYFKASSIRVIDKIRIPTLIVHAQDDPFIPFTPLRGAAVAQNPYILMLAPGRGGHVAFIAAKPARFFKASRNSDQSEAQSDTRRSNDQSRFTIYDSPSEDRFWAENRVIEFCKLANDGL
jgi:predicted alpha/beta-fold hydrolase